MAFKGLFGRGRDTAPAPAVDERASTEPSDATADDDADDTPEAAPARSWRERAEAVLPTGASTGSKRAEALYGTLDADGPTHFVDARGCHLTSVTGDRYLDCTMALGAVAIGYADGAVTRAVQHAAANGNVTGLSWCGPSLMHTSI